MCTSCSQPWASELLFRSRSKYFPPLPTSRRQSPFILLQCLCLRMCREVPLRATEVVAAVVRVRGAFICSYSKINCCTVHTHRQFAPLEPAHTSSKCPNNIYKINLHFTLNQELDFFLRTETPLKTYHSYIKLHRVNTAKLKSMFHWDPWFKYVVLLVTTFNVHERTCAHTLNPQFHLKICTGTALWLLLYRGGRGR